MRNIWTIFRDDMQHLFSNVMSFIIMVGLVVLPSIFAWYNILACWDVFESTGNLKVAVASTDAGYESDLVPIEVNIGEKVVSALRANDQIDWVITSEEDAIDGTKAGRYYAAVVIPESFSTDMLTFYTEDMQHAKIYYYVNKKKNAIAPNITAVGADTVSYEINQTFAQTLSEVSLGLSQSLAEQADESDLDGQVGDLCDHLRSIADRMDETAQVLGLFASLSSDSQSLVSGCADLVQTTRDQVSGTAAIVDAQKQNISSVGDTLYASTGDLSQLLDQNSQSMSNLQGSIDSIFASVDVQDVAAGLRDQATVVDGHVSSFDSLLADLQAIRSLVPDEHATSLDSAISTVSDARNVLANVRDALNTGASNLESGQSSIQEERDRIQAAADQASADIDATKASFEQDLKPGLDQLSADLGVVVDDLGQGMANLDAMGGDLPGSLDSVSSALGTATDKVNESSGKLSTASQDMRALADEIDLALATDDEGTLQSLLSGDPAQLAGALSAPVEMERIAVFPSEGFGSAMSPLYNTLALFIGSLVIMVAVKPTVSARGMERLNNAKPRQLYFGRFGAISIISILQSTILALGNLLFLQVQAVHPLLYMLCFWVSGLVFVFIIYTLVVAFGNLGKAIAVLMLIIQVTGCGGSYPLQILPGFVQQLSPFLPATHVVNAMRAAMMGVYANDFWIEVGLLLMFLIPALLLGLVLRKPLEKFMTFYVSKVEASGLVE